MVYKKQSSYAYEACAYSYYINSNVLPVYILDALLFVECKYQPPCI